MTLDQKRIKVAEACGWHMMESETLELHFPGGYLPTKNMKWFDKSVKDNPFKIGGLTLEQLPDFPNNLNAMHEAEKVLDTRQQVWYLQKLTQVRFKAGVSGMIACMIDKTTFATASQRFEAFGLTLGLWKEGE